MVSISESPGNNGWPVAISPTMQPKDQMSMDGPYHSCPSRTSGARYQRVTTSWVYTFSGTEKLRARPKSASTSRGAWLVAPSGEPEPAGCLETSTFCGFRSRCRMRRAWQNSMPAKHWRDALLRASPARGPAFLRYILRSMSRHSNTRCRLTRLLNTSWSRTTLGCRRSWSSEISRSAVEGTPSSSGRILIFLIATAWPVWRHMALYTVP
mmetsp:Transcript_35903/g.100886  ORF Transcript_35903/g.100886 Transcript_35903/m.100886 type:complete len:210 (-) Transcript_35903:226-855(-)